MIDRFMATAAGYRVIERGLRPDGTPRKPIKVREGYQPPDEMEAYVPPHKAAQTNHETITSIEYNSIPKTVIEDSPVIERHRTKNQIKNEKKRKNRRENKLSNSMKQSPPEHNDHLLDKESYKTLQNGTPKNKTQASGATNSVDIINLKSDLNFKNSEGNKETHQTEVKDETSEQVQDLEKQLKKLRKKLDQIVKLQSKDILNEEEKVKVGKSGEWEEDIKSLEEQIRDLKIK